MTKAEWTDQHIVVGLLFLATIPPHAYPNWKPIVAYLKNKARKVLRRLFTSAFSTG